MLSSDRNCLYQGHILSMFCHEIGIVHASVPDTCWSVWFSGRICSCTLKSMQLCVYVCVIQLMFVCVYVCVSVCVCVCVYVCVCVHACMHTCRHMCVCDVGYGRWCGVYDVMLWLLLSDLSAYASFMHKLVSEFKHGCLLWFLCRVELHVIFQGVLTYNVYSSGLLRKVIYVYICFVLGSDVHCVSVPVLHLYCSEQLSTSYMEKHFRKNYYQCVYLHCPVWLLDREWSWMNVSQKWFMCPTLVQ